MLLDVKKEARMFIKMYNFAFHSRESHTGLEEQEQIIFWTNYSLGGAKVKGSVSFSTQFLIST